MTEGRAVVDSLVIAVGEHVGERVLALDRAGGWPRVIAATDEEWAILEPHYRRMGPITVWGVPIVRRGSPLPPPIPATRRVNTFVPWHTHAS